jgi:hypothetical protein
MKKILVLFAVILAAVVSLSAQSNVRVGNNDNFVTINKSVVLDEGAEATSLVFDMSEKGSWYYYAITAKLNSAILSAVDSVPVLKTKLQYSYDGVAYTDLDSASFLGTQADTSILFLQSSSTVIYPFMKLEFTMEDDSLSVWVKDIYGHFISK